MESSMVLAWFLWYKAKFNLYGDQRSISGKGRHGKRIFGLSERYPSFRSFIVWKRKKKYRIFFENESKHRVRVGKEITEEAGIDKYLFDKMLYTITLLYTISLHLE